LFPNCCPDWDQDELEIVVDELVVLVVLHELFQLGGEHSRFPKTS
jgi:hypothetical protein